MTDMEQNNWILTDDDCLQFCRPAPEFGERVFELIQINSYAGHVDGKPFFQVAHGHVHLDEYSEEETNEILSMYDYDGIAGLKEAYSNPSEETVHQLMAEMFFETEIQEFVVEECSSWNEAVCQVQKVVQMDLQEYFKRSAQDFVLVADPSNGNLSLSALGELPGGFFLGGENVRCVPFGVPEKSAIWMHQALSELTGDDNLSVYIISPQATEALSSLLSPIVDAGIGRDKHMFPLPAIHWAAQHKEYVDSLDAVFYSLGLLSVKRDRRSVTQGEAVVSCNGKQIVRYGDKICMHTDKVDPVFASCSTDQPLYEPIIGGWGSVYPDIQFRQAALTQYGSDIVRALQQDRTLDSKIRQAQEQLDIPANRSTGMERKESER